MRISWRTNLWLIPSLTVGAALTAFVVSQTLDWWNHIGAVALPGWLDQGSAADARALLSATAGAIITTLGLVLSITVLTLSIAASQFGQRLLRRYMRDKGTQACIGIFAATFVFTLLTLLSVTSRPNEKEYVPWLSIWISTLWALTCIGVLIYFINHVALIIQVNNVLAELSAEFQWALHQRDIGRGPSGQAIPEMQPELALLAPASGYLESIDHHALVAAAAEANAMVRLLWRPGQFVVRGTTLAWAEGRQLSGSRLQNAFRGAVRIGVRRSLRQDPEFAIAQIVEVALRAMSPSVNDPNTALTCVNWLAECLRALAQCPPRSPAHVDSNGNIRVIESANEFEDVVATAYDPIRQFARNSTLLTVGMLNTISLVAPFVQSEAGREALNNQAQLVSEGLSPEALVRDRDGVAAAYRRAVAALHPPDGPKLASVLDSQPS